MQTDRATGMDLTDLWAKAGLMARESLEPHSRYAAVLATPSLGGNVFSARVHAGTATILTGQFPVNYPYNWLRLQRDGSVFRGFASYDGQLWYPLGSVTLTLPDTILFGMAVIKTGSLLAGMAFHMLNNAIAITFLYLSTRMDLDGAINSIDGLLYLALLLASLLGLKAGLARLQGQSRAKPLLQGRASWLPRGWFNWAILVAFVLFFFLAFLELFMGFHIV